jgi:hypothetical protein
VLKLLALRKQDGSNNVGSSAGEAEWLVVADGAVGSGDATSSSTSSSSSSAAAAAGSTVSAAPVVAESLTSTVSFLVGNSSKRVLLQPKFAGHQEGAGEGGAAPEDVLSTLLQSVSLSLALLRVVSSRVRANCTKSVETLRRNCARMMYVYVENYLDSAGANNSDGARATTSAGPTRSASVAVAQALQTGVRSLLDPALYYTAPHLPGAGGAGGAVGTGGTGGTVLRQIADAIASAGLLSSAATATSTGTAPASFSGAGTGRSPQTQQQQQRRKSAWLWSQLLGCVEGAFGRPAAEYVLRCLAMTHLGSEAGAGSGAEMRLSQERLEELFESLYQYFVSVAAAAVHSTGGAATATVGSSGSSTDTAAGYRAMTPTVAGLLLISALIAW